jgi:enamine deaminase RidA (YjgF/YER057c/UK114 family)
VRAPACDSADSMAVLKSFKLTVLLSRALPLFLSLLILSSASSLAAKRKDDEEPKTQVLPALKEPPQAVAADTSRIVFHVSPLSAKGLLSRQTRDALKYLIKVTRGATIVKLRAFVAGTGDARRVQTLVSEMFSDKKRPLPALSTIQVGALPLEGAQVVIESIAEDKKLQNPNGLAFFSGTGATTAAGAIEALQSLAKAPSVPPVTMLRVTCFVSSLSGVEDARSAAASVFPSAAPNFVQPLRASAKAAAQCEGVGRRGNSGSAPVAFVSRDGAAVALVNTPKLVFSGTQMAFGAQDADLRLAYERLGKSIESLGVAYKDVVFAHLYPLTLPIEEKAAALDARFFSGPGRPRTALLFEGLPSLDATMALEVVAAAQN